jgi:hypothetical protein
LGAAERDSGQSRVPLPPAMMTGTIFEDMRILLSVVSVR